MQPVMTIPDVERFLELEFPQLNADGPAFTVEDVAPGTLTLRLEAGERHLRPGGTVSGPSLFALADVAAYVAILAHIGPRTHVVTTNMSINFLRRPAPGLVLAKATLLKLGRRLAVVEVAIHAGGEASPSAHAVGTYSIPAESHEVS